MKQPDVKGFLKLPIIFIQGSGEEIDKLERLGIERDTMPTVLGVIYINPLNISSFNEASNGKTTIETALEKYIIELKFDEFVRILNQFNRTM